MNSQAPKTVIYSWLHVIAKVMCDQGYDPHSFFSKWDIEYNPTSPQDARIPTHKVFRALSQGATLLTNEDFGLLLGKNILPTMFSGLVTAAIASENQVSALKVICDNFHIVCESVRPTLIENGDKIYVCLNSTDEIIPPTSVFEAFFSALKYGGKTYMGIHTPPLSVHFSHDKPVNHKSLSAFFESDMHYSQPLNYIILDAHSLKQTAHSHDRVTQGIALGIVNRYSNSLQQKHYSEAVEFYLKRAVYNKRLTLEEVADQLNIGKRKLQNALHSEGTRFSMLQDKVLYDGSSTLLAQTTLSVEQIADKLGYQSGSNFCRAYKAWSGQTPNQYRLALHSKVSDDDMKVNPSKSFTLNSVKRCKLPL